MWAGLEKERWKAARPGGRLAQCTGRKRRGRTEAEDMGVAFRGIQDLESTGLGDGFRGRVREREG